MSRCPESTPAWRDDQTAGRLPIKILIVSQHFWPESFRINGLVRSLNQAGCHVTVLTGQPNYPQGVVFNGYAAWKATHQEHEDGYTVYRVPLIPRGRATAFRLIANYASFVLSAALIGPWLLRRTQFDVIFVYGTSPILQVVPAIVLKWLKRATLVTWVQDLWPESLAATGFVRNRSVLKLVERLVRWIYRRNDLLLGQSRGFVTAIQKLSGPTPVELFPNPGDFDSGNVLLEGEPALWLEPGFNVVFAGNFGTVQALGTVLEAAELLHPDPEVRFVLVGSGSRGDWLKSEIARRGLTNVRVPGRFPAERLPGIIAQASALLVCLVRSPTMSLTIPAKIQTYLAAGRPIIAALDGEGAQLVLEARAGLSVPAEDARALADAVLRLRSFRESERAQMGEAGRRYYQKHFASDVLVRQLTMRFRDLVDGIREGPSSPETAREAMS